MATPAGRPQQLRLNLDSVDPLDSSGFRAAVSQALVPLEFACPDPESFSGRLTVTDGGGVMSFRVAAAEHSVHRTRALITRAPRRMVKFSLLEAGTGFIVQDGRETALGPGDMTIYDTNRPYSLVFGEEIRMSAVMFPVELLGLPPVAVSRITATRLGGDRGAGPAIRAFLSTLHCQISETPDRIARGLIQSSVKLIGLLVEAQLCDLQTSQDHETQWHRIVDYVDENLSLSELNPRRIASAHFISVRHLHGLFASRGATVSGLIRGRRLERCYDQLSDSRFANRSIAAIATSNGFVSPAHFSRAFRGRFGLPPSEVRARSQSVREAA